MLRLKPVNNLIIDNIITFKLDYIMLLSNAQENRNNAGMLLYLDVSLRQVLIQDPVNPILSRKAAASLNILLTEIVQ